MDRIRQFSADEDIWRLHWGEDWLSRSHLGLRAEHRRHAFVLDDATAAPIADAVRTIMQDPALKARLATGARDFYQEALRERGEHLHSFLCALANRKGAGSRRLKADAPAASVATPLDDHPVPRAGNRTPRDAGTIQTLNRVQGQP
ncbi:hypothetical protein [Thiorhodococcus minor]|uniref:Uncharacterized protein n=1 Tax=Thiorhodococcus minor TaxID=57489 RepID=A0A6M0K7S9_9GAMM|nr:hypothetical protein [Thiorhodococcus minor]NEV65374.1 hypothetical protein [Thiorhodococcus minor]